MKKGVVKTCMNGPDGLTPIEVPGLVSDSGWFGIFKTAKLDEELGCVGAAVRKGYTVVQQPTGGACSDSFRRLIDARKFVRWLESVPEFRPGWRSKTPSAVVKQLKQNAPGALKRITRARQDILRGREPEAKPLGTGNPMVDQLQANSLRATCGRAITCRCGTILDAPQAVEVTAKKGGEVFAVEAICLRCWEHREKDVRRRAAKHGLSIEVIDGRDIDWDLHGGSF